MCRSFVLSRCPSGPGLGSPSQPPFAFVRSRLLSSYGCALFPPGRGPLLNLTRHISLLRFVPSDTKANRARKPRKRSEAGSPISSGEMYIQAVFGRREARERYSNSSVGEPGSHRNRVGAGKRGLHRAARLLLTPGLAQDTDPILVSELSERPIVVAPAPERRHQPRQARHITYLL